jgi:hypothetical protein
MRGENDIALGREGMERDRHPSHLGQAEYDFALNANIASESGDELLLQNEPGNVMCSRLLGGKVCGYRTDPDDARVVWYFLSFADGTSRIVTLRSADQAEMQEDAYAACGCDFRREPGERAEESESRYDELCGAVETVLEDCVTDVDGSDGRCLGFDVRTPVYDVLIKNEKCGKRVYWAQRGKPARYMDVAKAKDRDSEYYYRRKPLCGEEDQEGERTCLNGDMLRIFPLLSVPCVEVEAIQFGGNLRSGVYEFLVAYCDQEGVETGSYCALTDPVPVFDDSSVVTEGNDYGRPTSLGIRLRVSGLDSKATFYKLAVIQAADVNNGTLCFIEGIHPVTETDVTLSTSALPGNYREGDPVGIYRMTTLTHLSTEKTVYRTASGMATSGKMLFQYGLEAEAEWNLQPVANLLGCLMRWQTVVAGEELYRDGAATAKYRGYMRDEVYPFGIRFVTDTGYRTAVFPLAGRPMLEGEGDDVSGSESADVRSVLENAPACAANGRKYRWQFYNTAKREGIQNLPGEDAEGCPEIDCEEPVEIEEERACEGKYYQLRNPDEEWIEVGIDSGFVDLKSYINEYIDRICSDRNKHTLIEKICIAMHNGIEAGTAGLTEEFCLPSDMFPCGCSAPQLVADPERISVWIEDISGEQRQTIYRMFESPILHEYGSDVLAEGGEGIRLSATPANASKYVFNDFDIPREDIVECDGCNFDQEIIKSSIVGNFKLIVDEYDRGYENSGSSMAAAVEITKYNGNFYKYTSIKRYAHEGQTFEDGTVKYHFVRKNMTAANLKDLADKWSAGFIVFLDETDLDPGSGWYNPWVDSPHTYPSKISDDSLIAGIGDNGLLLEKAFGTGEYYDVTVYSTFAQTSRENAFGLNLYTSWLKENIEASCSNVFTDHSIHRWSQYLHKGTRWFKISRPAEWVGDGWPVLDDRREAYYVLQYVPCRKLPLSSLDYEGNDYWDVNIYQRDILTTQKIRVTAFNERGEIMDNPFHVGRLTLPKIIEASEPYVGKITKRLFDEAATDTIYLAVDTPVAVTGWIFNGYSNECDEKDVNIIVGRNIATTTTEGQFGFTLIPAIPKKIKFTFDSITFNKRVFYRALCTYCIPEPTACETVPYEYGRFGYWESEEKYPSNAELFDSSRLHITSEMLAEGGMDADDLAEFLRSYPIANGRIASANFCQKPIRHYKFPDNAESPFMYSLPAAPGSAGIIYPIGAHIKKSTVRAFLKVAVENNLITEEQEHHIIGYEIFRGDRSLNRGVVAAGLGYDMYKYTDSLLNESDSDVWFSNFPYNDLRENSYIGKSKEAPKDYLAHPYGSLGNVKYTFHSPDTSFNKPRLPVECRIEGYQFGSSNGMFRQVEGHPKWVVLSPRALRLAARLADIEIVGVLTGTAGESLSSIVQGFSDSVMSGIGSVIGALGKAIGLVTDVYRWAMIRYEWIQTFMRFGTPENMAFYYSSEGNYNYFRADGREGNTLRGMTVCKYANPGRHVTNEKDYRFRINAVDREGSVVISFDAGNKPSPDYMVNYPPAVLRFDNSRIPDECEYSAEGGEGMENYWTREYRSQICSPYMKLKHYLPAQYGSLWSIQWVGTGGCHRFDSGDDDSFIWGGDTVISRFALKRKFPFFLYNAMGMADMMPFAYRDYRNAGNPLYYVNYQTDEEEEGRDGYMFPRQMTNYNLFCRVSRKYYVKGKFYLFMYGIPSFLVESEINCNFRQAGVTAKENFYPNAGDYADWTQEQNVSIKEDNVYKYNPVYSKSKSRPGYRLLPSTYERQFWDCRAQLPNGIIWSSPDVSENGQTDPWLTFKPLDYYEFPTSLGRLTDVRGIESEQLLARFENQTALYNAIDVLRDRLNPELGGGVFAQRGMEYNSTDLGYAGSQSKEMVSCEYGHFWVDAKRGQAFQVDPNGRNMKEITKGVMQWMKEHLPYRILRYNIINIETEEPVSCRDFDSKFAGMGITMGWDSRFKRVFLTKRDYLPNVIQNSRYRIEDPDVRDFKDLSLYKFYDGRFYYGEVDRQHPERNAVRLSDPEYFIDVSFTMAYSCLTGRWISYYSFIPDFYVSHQHYFQTGLNQSADARREGVWSHLLTNRSYQVFYGELHPFIVQIPLRGMPANRMLGHAGYRMECRRYQNELDYAVHRMTGFNRAWLFNQTNHSGELHLIPRERDNMVQDLRYPNLIYPYKEILATELDGTWRFNDFFNQVRNDLNNIPIWRRDVNGIMMEPDMRAIQWNTVWNDRMRGEWFLMRLENNMESRYQMLFGII